jgi:hypothetical protein
LISSFLEFSNMNFIFPFIWEFHHPNWRTPSFFQRGRKKPPTSHMS